LKGETTEEQIRKKQGKRLNDNDWNFLKNHWSSPESEVSTVPSCCLLVTTIFAAC
jgi:hypothetical protein